MVRALGKVVWFSFYSCHFIKYSQKGAGKLVRWFCISVSEQFCFYTIHALLFILCILKRNKSDSIFKVH